MTFVGEDNISGLEVNETMGYVECGGEEIWYLKENWL